MNLRDAVSGAIAAPAAFRLLIVSNLFADPFNPSRGTYNQEQFGRLAKAMDLTVLVPVSWLAVLRHPLAYRRLKREAVARWPCADYVVYWYLPGIGRRLHAASLFLSLLLQRFPTLFLRHWDCVLGSWGYPDAVAACALAALRRTPFVAKVHGTDINGFTREPARRAQIRWALNRARHVVAVSAALRARLTEIGVDPARTSVLYNGVDMRRFLPLPQRESKLALGYTAETRLLLFIGNVQRSKGCANLLEAFARLASRLPALRLVYVGPGPQVAELTARAGALGLAERVDFAGRKAHDELAPWFCAADLFCLPSHSEGVPNVILEAMACGTPVVATDVGGVAEVLPDHAGLLVPPQDVPALAAALFTALGRSWDRARLIEHAAGFQWEANVARLDHLLRQAAHDTAADAAATAARKVAKRAAPKR